jgi:hypothetical protein
MIKITKIVNTCPGCPAQWDAWTSEGKYYFIRYRWGGLRVDVDDVSPETIYCESVGPPLDGLMTFDELKGHLKDLMQFDCEEETEEE